MMRHLHHIVRAASPLVIVALFFFLFVFAPDALACAVCQDAQEKNRGMFVATTWLLSLLPLAMIGSIVYVIVKRAREEEREIDETVRRASENEE
jgi:hypothetical protein